VRSSWRGRVEAACNSRLTRSALACIYTKSSTNNEPTNQPTNVDRAGAVLLPLPRAGGPPARPRRRPGPIPQAGPVHQAAGAEAPWGQGGGLGQGEAAGGGGALRESRCGRFSFAVVMGGLWWRWGAEGAAGRAGRSPVGLQCWLGWEAAQKLLLQLQQNPHHHPPLSLDDPQPPLPGGLQQPRL